MCVGGVVCILVCLFHSFFFLSKHNMFLHITEKCQVPLPPCNRSIKSMRRRGRVRRLEVWQTGMLSFTGQARKTLNEIRTHFPQFHQCHGGRLLWPYGKHVPDDATHIHVRKLEGELCATQNCSLWGFIFFIYLFFHAGPDTKSWDIKRCPDSVVWVSIILALMALSLNHGEAANCQVLCPHYPCPPAQTGALGHCPRNHSAPVASQES